MYVVIALLNFGVAASDDVDPVVELDDDLPLPRVGNGSER